MCVDVFRWLQMGCKDSMVYFVGYQYLKSITRTERCLHRQKTQETTDSLETEEKPDTLKLLETNTA